MCARTVKTKLILGLSGLCFTLGSPLVLFASSGTAPQSEAAPKADPDHPTSLDSKDPSFEDLATSTYKPNSKYVIRNFKEGTVHSLEALISSLSERSKANLKEISSLQEKAGELDFSEKEKLVVGLAEIRKQQVDYLRTLQNYSKGPYQTNISLEKMRSDLKVIDTEVSNLKNLLGSWQTSNSVSWE